MRTRAVESRSEDPGLDSTALVHIYIVFVRMDKRQKIAFVYKSKENWQV